MNEEVDEYIREVIQKGDKGSKLLAARTAITLHGKEHIQVLKGGVHGIAVLRIPEEYNVVVHSAGGDPSISDISNYAASMVENLVAQAKIIEAIPLGFGNVIDASVEDDSMLEKIANAYVGSCNQHNIAVMNGELAILGDRVTVPANISGTMISIVKKELLSADEQPRVVERNGVYYAIFDAQGKPVYINSDGVGTKTEFYERARNYGPALEDLATMNLDDAKKLGAVAKVLSAVVETSGNIPLEKVYKHAKRLAEQIKVSIILQPKAVDGRLQSYKAGIPAYNLSGSVVSVIDEERLANPLKPQIGDYLIAIAGVPNPRSNGITAKRKIMTEMLGIDWHETDKGKIFLPYLSTPSTILYPVFHELLEQNIATSFYHMSGGAFDGKLARPLREHGVRVNLQDLFEPDTIEIELMKYSNTGTKAAYSKWPMGTDGFITTPKPYETISAIENLGLRARIVGQLEAGSSIMAAVALRAFNGEMIYFSGK